MKKACAKAGVYPDQSADELLDGLIKHYQENNLGTSSSNSNSSSGDSNQEGKVDPVKVAKAVLELDEYDDFAGILNLAIPPGKHNY